MVISVNDEVLDVTLEGEKTLGDVLVGLETELSRVGAAVGAVEVDGKAVVDVTAVAQTPVAAVTSVNLDTVTAAEVREALKGQADKAAAAAARLENLAVLLQSGKQAEADEVVQGVTAVVETLTHLAKLASLFPESFSGASGLDAFFHDLPPLLRDFCTAIEERDIVGMGDLGEYEIKPRLETLADVLRGL
jgi:hypothetical protein